MKGEPSRYKRLIRCTSESCSSETVDIYNTSTYFLNFDSKNTKFKYDELIKCFREVTNKSSSEQCDQQEDGSHCGEQNYGKETYCTLINNDVTGDNVKHFLSDFEGEQYDDRLVTCTSEGCYLEDENIVGYFVNSDQIDGKIIMCVDKDCDILGNGLVFRVCDDAGDIIIKKNGKHSICLNNNISVELSDDNEGNYVINGCEENIFTSDESNYAIISLNKHSVYLNKNYNKKYVYVDASTNGKQRVIEKYENKCPTKETDSGITVDYNNILELSECNNGICTEINSNNKRSKLINKEEKIY